MLAKKVLRRAILGFTFGLLMTLGDEAGAAQPLARFGIGGGPLSQLWRFIVKAAELVLPGDGVDLEGGYIDPNGRS